MTNTMKLMYVEWIDSAGIGRWTHLSELSRNVAPLLCTTVGWLAGESDEAVVLVSSVAREGDDPPHTANGDITIPKCAITGSWELEV